MKKSFIIATALSALLLQPSGLEAYPPAPHHLFFGTVRDERGNPLRVEDARVVLKTTSGTVITGKILRRDRDGINYRLEIPLDSGMTSDAYQPTALRPTVPFTIRVTAGTRTYLPIEMVGVLAHLGEPGKTTRLDLTLGEDTDGDGIPDAWERDLIDSVAALKNLADVNPHDDADGDGLSNLQEYLAGSYAFDQSDGFELKIERFAEGRPVLEWLAIRERSYTILGSRNLREWSAVSVRFLDATDAESFESFVARDVVRMAVVPAGADSGFRYFKVLAR